MQYPQTNGLLTLYAGHPAHWTGQEMASTQWWRSLEETEIAGLETMTREIVYRIGDDLNGLRSCTTDDVVAPAIARLAAEIQSELTQGKGFVVLRGFPLDRWPRRDAFISYWLLGKLLGRPVPNNAYGDMIGHVADLGLDVEGANTRGYETNDQLAYHCDQCDIVGLMCLQKSKSGGVSKLVSSMALHDAIGKSRPDLLEVLCGPFCYSRLGEGVAGQHPWYVAHVFEKTGTEFHCAAGFHHIRKGHEVPGAPAMTGTQREALLFLEDVCPSIEFSMGFEPGDIQLVNNGLILHNRTAFEDWPDPVQHRHLLRLWLQVPDMHRGAAYFENWCNGVTPADGTPKFRLSP